LSGIKPNPLLPILTPSFMCTSFSSTEFLITTKDPIEQFSPIFTSCSIIELFPIAVFFPIWTFSPISTFFPNFTSIYLSLICSDEIRV